MKAGTLGIVRRTNGFRTGAGNGHSGYRLDMMVFDLLKETDTHTFSCDPLLRLRHYPTLDRRMRATAPTSQRALQILATDYRERVFRSLGDLVAKCDDTQMVLGGHNRPWH